MKKFIITEEQVNAVLSVLGELPAKNVIIAVDLLRFQLVEAPAYKAEGAPADKAEKKAAK
jgi:hypothetical protein